MNYPTTSTTGHTPKPTRQKVAEYLEKGLTVRQIANLLGVTTQAVYKLIKKHGIERPDQGSGA